MIIFTYFTFFELISEKQDEKDACNQKKDILRPVQQDVELKDRGPKKKDSPCWKQDV